MIFTQVPRKVIEDESLTTIEKLALITLIDRANYFRKAGDQFECTEEWLATKCGCSDRSIRTAIKTLTENKWIFKTQTRDEKGHKHNQYTLNKLKLGMARETVKTDWKEFTETHRQEREEWIEQHREKPLKVGPDWFENGQDIDYWFNNKQVYIGV